MTTTKKAKYARLNADAKIVVLAAGRENPRRVGTAAHKRAGCVLRANGKLVRDALRAGARTSTEKHLVASGLVRLVAGKPAAKRAA